MNLRLLAALALMPPVLAIAQTADDANEGLRLSVNVATGALDLAWWGRAGRVYFIEHSEDLHVWHALPAFEAGADAPITYGLSGNSARLFTRVRWIDATLPQFQIGDYDGDGINNAAEATAGLNPFARDSDGDGLPDGYELAFGLDAFAKDGTGDLDGDGVPNHQDSRPNDSAKGILSISVLAPADGSSL